MVFGSVAPVTPQVAKEIKFRFVPIYNLGLHTRDNVNYWDTYISYYENGKTRNDVMILTTSDKGEMSSKQAQVSNRVINDGVNGIYESYVGPTDAVITVSVGDFIATTTINSTYYQD
jgi:hypothetical protein